MDEILDRHDLGLSRAEFIALHGEMAQRHPDKRVIMRPNGDKIVIADTALVKTLVPADIFRQLEIAAATAGIPSVHKYVALLLTEAVTEARK